MAELLRIICISASRFVVTKNVGKGKKKEKKGMKRFGEEKKQTAGGWIEYA